MNIKDIKVGETYNLELLCILNKEKIIVFETPTGDHIPLRISDIECVSPANGTPVEELELYYVRHNEAHAAWSIYGPYNLSAVNYFYGERYPYTEEAAKAAAGAECKRLNDEWRKGQE